jgi:hypothetical protein
LVSFFDDPTGEPARFNIVARATPPAVFRSTGLANQNL